MRIAMVSNACSVHTQRWACAFSQRGHDVHLLSIRKAEIPGTTMHPVMVGPVNAPCPLWTAASYTRLLASIRSRLRPIQPDVIHAGYALTHGAIAGLRGLRPVVVSAWGADVIYDGPGEMPRLRTALLRRAFAEARIICATSHFLAEHTARFTPSSADIRITPFGVDLDVFGPMSSRPRHGGVVFGLVKSLSEKYGPHILLEAFAEAHQELPDSTLIVVGDGPMRSALVSQAKELGISGQVTFAGSIPHGKVPALLGKLDVFVHPSIHQSESFGVAVLEASACGLPVIATRVGGVPEVCVDGQTGLLVPPRDPHALARRMIQLGQDAELRRALGQAGRSFVQDHYAWDSCVDRMEACLLEAAATS